jgi:hypothetical protein
MINAEGTIQRSKWDTLPLRCRGESLALSARRIAELHLRCRMMQEFADVLVLAIHSGKLETSHVGDE